MKSIVTLLDSKNIFARHGEDTVVGLTLVLKGTFHEELANRLMFGSDYGAAPDDIKGNADKFFWGKDNLRYYGIDQIKAAKTSFLVNANIGDETLKECTISKGLIIPTPSRGIYEIKFQLFIPRYEERFVHLLESYANEQVKLELVVVQTDITETDEEEE